MNKIEWCSEEIQKIVTVLLQQHFGAYSKLTIYTRHQNDNDYIIHKCSIISVASTAISMTVFGTNYNIFQQQYFPV